jgi:hypothetical protein
VIAVFALLPIAAVGRTRKLDSKYHRPSVIKHVSSSVASGPPSTQLSMNSLVAETEIKTPTKPTKPLDAASKLN